LQRCARNSVEQLGQIEDASCWRFAETKFAATPVAVSPALNGVEPGERPVEFGVKRMSGFVAQIRLRENTNVP
jgi:hypothetical protein